MYRMKDLLAQAVEAETDQSKKTFLDQILKNKERVAELALNRPRNSKFLFYMINNEENIKKLLEFKNLKDDFLDFT